MALTRAGSTPPFSAPLIRHIDNAASLSAASRPLSDTASSNSSLRAAMEGEGGREREREREEGREREGEGGRERERERRKGKREGEGGREREREEGRGRERLRERERKGEREGGLLFKQAVQCMYMYM